MKSQASELRQAAARHRSVREAQQGNKSERRSVFGKRRHVMTTAREPGRNLPRGRAFHPP